MKDRLKLLLVLLFVYFIFIDPGELSKIIANLDANKLTALGTLAAVIVALAISVWKARFEKLGGLKPRVLIKKT